MKKQIVIESRISNISIVERLVDEVSEKTSLNSDLYGKILVATLEAVNNAIIHGNNNDPTKPVVIDVDVETNQVSISIKDTGNGFNYLDIPDPTLPVNIENVSGRGVFLMTKLADQVIYNDNGAHVELIFKL